MIITALLKVVLSIFDALLSLLPSIPALPESVTEILDTCLSYFTAGLAMLSNFVYMDVVTTLITLFLAMVSFKEIWRFIWWIVRKIPFLGVE